MEKTMKALTLHQPWAQLIALGCIHIETRTWRSHYRGELAIHAAKSIPDYAKLACLEAPVMEVFEKMGYCRREGEDIVYKLPRGAVVAVTKLVDCIPVTDEFISNMSDEERAFGDLEVGLWAWILEDVRRLEKPVPYRGRQGLWNIKLLV